MAERQWNVVETLDLGIDGLDHVELIGRGGSSRVYRARQTELDRLVALKVINVTDDSDVARRFDRERKAMGRLSLNDGIVPIYSSGLTDNGEPYLIMPYYPNGSLQDRLERGRVPWTEAVEYITAVAATLAAAHQSGVVHLDLKPANILLAANGTPRIADFGIAKLISEQAAAKTTGAAFTPSFSAPEALLGGATTAASDVYGLAATLWALIAGRAPFRDIDGDNSLMAVIGRVVHHQVPDLRHLAPDSICSIIETGMAKEPSARYPTAGAFAQALASAAGAQSAPAHSQGAAGQAQAGYQSALDQPPRNGNGQSPLPAAAVNGAADLRLSGSERRDLDATGPIGQVDSSPVESRGRLRIGEAVPPTFVPAGPNSPSLEVARGTWLVLAAGSVIVVIISLLAAITMLSDNGDASPDTSLPAANSGPLASTSATLRGAQAGASNSSPAGPTTIVATTTSPGTSRPSTSDSTSSSQPTTSSSSTSTTASTLSTTSPSSTTVTTRQTTTSPPPSSTGASTASTQSTTTSTGSTSGTTGTSGTTSSSSSTSSTSTTTSTPAT